MLRSDLLPAPFSCPTSSLLCAPFCAPDTSSAHHPTDRCTQKTRLGPSRLSKAVVEKDRKIGHLHEEKAMLLQTLREALDSVTKVSLGLQLQPMWATPASAVSPCCSCKPLLQL